MSATESSMCAFGKMAPGFILRKLVVAIDGKTFLTQTESDFLAATSPIFETLFIKIILFSLCLSAYFFPVEQNRINFT